MTTFDLTYNPFTKEKKFFKNGKKDSLDECWGIGNKELSEWCGDFFKKLYAKYNDREMEVNFKGILRDYEFLEDAKEAYEKEDSLAKITLKDGGCANTSEKLDELKKIFEEMQNETPFESLRSKEVKDLFDKVVSSEFEMAVVATMSSGKSTLINAMLGCELLPARNEATTATLAKIHDEDGADHFKGKSYDKDRKELASCDPLTLENMDELNDNPETSVIEIHGDIVGIESKDLQLVLTDTPGPNNSRTDKHKEHTYSLLEADYKPMILYVLNGTQLETNDDNTLLKYIAEKMNSGGRQAQERFIFVLNKADEFDPDKGERVPQKVEDVKAYLAKHKIHDARVFPVAARMAKLIRQSQSKQPPKPTEMENAEIQIKHKLFIKSAWWHFSDFAPLSLAAKKAQDAMLKSALENNDEYQQALIYTGVPAVELAVSEYLTKYALPAKITEGVYSFKEKIEKLGIEIAEIEKLEGNEAEVEKLQGALKEIEAELEKGKKADEVRETIDSLSVKRRLKDEFESLGKNLMNQIRIETEEMKGNKTEEEAKEHIDRLKGILSNLETKFRVDVENALNEGLKRQAEEAVEIYNEYLEKLIGKVEYDIPPAAILGDLASISVDETLSVYTRKVAVGSHEEENTDKKWYKPWTWFQPKYYTVTDYGERVDFSEYIKKVIGDNIVESIKSTRELVFDYAKEEEDKFKTFFKKQIDKLDGAVKSKLEEKQKSISSKEALEKTIEQNKKNIAWINDLMQKLDSLLDI